MAATITPAEDAIYTAVKSYIESLLVDSTGAALIPASSIVKGYPNGVAMPEGPFVALTATIQDPLNVPFESYDPNAASLVAIDITQSVQVTLQIDVYGPAAGDWARILDLAWRTEYCVNMLSPACVPLYTTSTVRMPLTDGEKQYEDRWVIKAELEYDPTVSVPQQYADTATIGLINVDETYK